MRLILRTIDEGNIYLGNAVDVNLKSNQWKNPKPPKENYKWRKQVCDNGKNNSDQEIYAYMARMYGNDECPSANFGDSSQLTNWILDSGA